MIAEEECRLAILRGTILITHYPLATMAVCLQELALEVKVTTVLEISIPNRSVFQQWTLTL